MPPTQEKPSSKIAARLAATGLEVGDGRGSLLLLLQDLEHLHQDVGIGEQVTADLAMERRAFAVAERRGEGRGAAFRAQHEIRHHDRIVAEGAGGRLLGKDGKGESDRRGDQGGEQSVHPVLNVSRASGRAR